MIISRFFLKRNHTIGHPRLFFEQAMQSTESNPVEEKYRQTALGLSKEIQPITPDKLSPEMRELFAKRSAKKAVGSSSTSHPALPDSGNELAGTSNGCAKK